LHFWNHEILDRDSVVEDAISTAKRRQGQIRDEGRARQRALRGFALKQGQDRAWPDEGTATARLNRR
jgi:hypothetical protein